MQKYKKLSIFAYKLKVNIQQMFYFVIFLPFINTSSPYEGFCPPGSEGGERPLKAGRSWKPLKVE